MPCFTSTTVLNTTHILNRSQTVSSNHLHASRNMRPSQFCTLCALQKGLHSHHLPPGVSRQHWTTPSHDVQPVYEGQAVLPRTCQDLVEIASCYVRTAGAPKDLVSRVTPNTSVKSVTCVPPHIQAQREQLMCAVSSQFTHEDSKLCSTEDTAVRGLLHEDKKPALNKLWRGGYLLT